MSAMALEKQELTALSGPASLSGRSLLTIINFVKKYKSPFQHFIIGAGRIVFDNIPISFIRFLIPVLSLERCLYDSFKLDPYYSGLRNYSKPLIVDGLHSKQALWFVEAIDRVPSDPVMVFFHGGGYMLGCFHLFVWFFKYLHERLDNGRLSILLVDYSLTPKYKFPKQLEEIDLVYKTLVAEGCKNLILSGDSAGAHLCVTYLKWLNLDIDNDIPLKTSDKITFDSPYYPKGLLLISPWLNLLPDEIPNSTYVSNKGKDILTAKSLTGYAKLFIDESYKGTTINLDLRTSKFLNHGIDDETDWEKVIPLNTFITIGDDEIMKDDILNWCVSCGLDEHRYVTDKDSFHEELMMFPENSHVIEENDNGPSILGFLKKFN